MGYIQTTSLININSDLLSSASLSVHLRDRELVRVYDLYRFLETRDVLEQPPAFFFYQLVITQDTQYPQHELRVAVGHAVSELRVETQAKSDGSPDTVPAGFRQFFESSVVYLESLDGRIQEIDLLALSLHHILECCVFGLVADPIVYIRSVFGNTGAW